MDALMCTRTRRHMCTRSILLQETARAVCKAMGLKFKLMHLKAAEKARQARAVS